MQAFEYARPKSLKEAIGLLSATWGEVDVLAGGTDLVSLMKEYIHTPKRVVDVKRIEELGGIERTSAGLRLGATVTLTQLLADAGVRSEYPALAAAAESVSSMQIRNVETVASEITQRPRCWYFRNGFGLLAMKDGKSLVENGENRYHAIFGAGPARFVSASRLGPALIALGAKIKIVSAAGEREVDAEAFFVSPANESSREVDLKPNEIVSAVVIPPAGGAKSATYEVRQREALDWPLAAASVMLKMSGGKVASARVVMGHVAPTPVMSKDAASYLSGKSVTEDVAERAGAAAVKGARPLSQNAYKVQLAKVAVKRALLAAAS